MMATAKERVIQAELLTDPDHKARWDDFRAALASMEADSLPDAGLARARVAKAAKAISELLERRPDLVALAELVDRADH